MFIGTSAEDCLLSLECMEAFEYIRQDKGIEVPDMWCYSLSATVTAANSRLRIPALT